MTAELNTEFEKWRNRPLPEIAHLILDALFVKVRIDGTVRDCAVFIAVGVRRDDGRRMILGLSTGLSEAEIHWRSFLASAEERFAQIVAKHEKKAPKLSAHPTRAKDSTEKSGGANELSVSLPTKPRRFASSRPS